MRTLQPERHRAPVAIPLGYILSVLKAWERLSYCHPIDEELGARNCEVACSNHGQTDCAKDQLTVIPHAHILQINSDEEKMIMARKQSCN